MLSLMAQPHSSWWMTPKQLATQGKKKKKAAKRGGDCLPPPPPKQWKIANVKDFLMAWLDIFRLVPLSEGIYLVYPLKSNASIKRYDDKVRFNLCEEIWFASAVGIISVLHGGTNKLLGPQKLQQQQQRRGHSNILKTGPFITPTTTTPTYQQHLLICQSGYEVSSSHE